MEKSYSESYAAAGVDITAGYRSVELMKQYVARTMNEHCIGGLGGFGGLFELDCTGYKHPVLISGTDGVGTKLKIAMIMDKHDTIGIDCVAMCVNDVICAGAKPLVFLDYIACGRNIPEKIAEIVKGVAEGCVQADCSLVGGETAEHPGMMPEDELAGQIRDLVCSTYGHTLVLFTSYTLMGNVHQLLRDQIPFPMVQVWRNSQEEIARFKKMENAVLFAAGSCWEGAPGFFFPSYVSSMEMQALQGIPADQLAPLLANLEEIRQSIFTSDAWRSFFVIMIGTAVLWSYGMGKLKAKVTILALAVLCLADMWSVNKRYLYDEQFVEKVQQDNSFKPTETDKAILADKTLDFRVLNLAGNTFNENTTSYWHKSIGGYHAAKLRRYQEMIEEHISTEMNGVFKAVSEAGGDMQKVAPSGFPVLNMLNTRYFIFPLQGGKTVPIQNPYTLGNAWFVNEVQYVDNANEEIDALHRIDPAKTAVVDKKFSAEVKSAAETDTLGTIKLTAYEPNDLKYEVNSKTGGTVVFSEIYYPGWQAYIDGVEAPHGRADYILRAMNVPAGKHVVEFKFDPKSLHVTETVAFVALGVLTCVLVLFLFLQVRRARRKID